MLLFVFWYCHKRGREVRLERERNEKGEPVDSNGRVIELDDDPMLGAPGPSRSQAHSRTPSHDSRRRHEQTGSDSSRRLDPHRDERPESSSRRQSHGSRPSSSRPKSGDRRREKEVEHERRH